jgi:hypothetical protein
MLGAMLLCCCLLHPQLPLLVWAMLAVVSGDARCVRAITSHAVGEEPEKSA